MALRLAAALLMVCLSIGLNIQPILAAPPDGPPIPEPDEKALETLGKIDQVSFSATPPVIRPFEPWQAVLNWRVRLPNDRGASGIRLTIEGIDGFVPAAGSRAVLPRQTTSYQLIAHLRKEQRALGAQPP
jgi:hypothetical protein